MVTHPGVQDKAGTRMAVIPGRAKVLVFVPRTQRSASAVRC